MVGIEDRHAVSSVVLIVLATCEAALLAKNIFEFHHANAWQYKNEDPHVLLVQRECAFTFFQDKHLSDIGLKIIVASMQPIQTYV